MISKLAENGQLHHDPAQCKLFHVDILPWDPSQLSTWDCLGIQPNFQALQGDIVPQAGQHMRELRCIIICPGTLGGTAPAAISECACDFEQLPLCIHWRPRAKGGPAHASISASPDCLRLQHRSRPFLQMDVPGPAAIPEQAAGLHGRPVQCSAHPRGKGVADYAAASTLQFVLFQRPQHWWSHPFQACQGSTGTAVPARPWQGSVHWLRRTSSPSGHARCASSRLPLAPQR